MAEATYIINGVRISENDPNLSRMLHSIYESKGRPICDCLNPLPGVEMYIAKVDGKLYVKRMPNTASFHSPNCDSYDEPPELSGLGQVMGTAIQEDIDSGITTLKLEFSLSKVPGRAPPVPSEIEHDTVKTSGSKLTLRAVLHYLWKDAGFNRWTPAMAGKRSWSVIRKYLMQAAANKMSKGVLLSDMLWIPEPYVEAKKDEITQRRVNMMMRASVASKGKKQLLMAIGDVKEIGQSRYGYKIRFRHADCDLMLNEDIYKSMKKRFANEFEMWDADNNLHLMAICTFSVSPSGTPSIEEISFVVVNPNWIPIENEAEKMVVDQMCSNNRRFTKGLRYNLPSKKPLASLVATDTSPSATAMYILPFGASTEYVAELETLIGESNLWAWQWKVGQSEMPALPQKR